jgi:hypothetical protein
VLGSDEHDDRAFVLGENMNYIGLALLQNVPSAPTPGAGVAEPSVVSGPAGPGLASLLPIIIVLAVVGVVFVMIARSWPRGSGPEASRQRRKTLGAVLLVFGLAGMAFAGFLQMGMHDLEAQARQDPAFAMRLMVDPQLRDGMQAAQGRALTLKYTLGGLGCVLGGLGLFLLLSLPPQIIYVQAPPASTPENPKDTEG